MQVLKSIYGNFTIIPNDGECYEDEEEECFIASEES